jgi:hypothetical protein
MEATGIEADAVPNPKPVNEWPEYPQEQTTKY